MCEDLPGQHFMSLRPRKFLRSAAINHHPVSLSISHIVLYRDERVLRRRSLLKENNGYHPSFSIHLLSFSCTVLLSPQDVPFLLIVPNWSPPGSSELSSTTLRLKILLFFSDYRPGCLAAIISWSRSRSLSFFVVCSGLIQIVTTVFERLVG